MTYKALDIAKWLIKEAGQYNITITPMKLQKLLYYAQAYALGMAGEPLFNDEIQAWKHGPVIPVVYNAYSKYGRDPITETDTAQIDEDAASLIRSVIKDKGYFSASELSEMTHNELPWQDAFKGWNGYGTMPIITSDAIEDYFVSKFWTSDEEDDYQPSFDTPEEEKKYFLEHITAEEYNAIFASR